VQKGFDCALSGLPACGYPLSYGSAMRCYVCGFHPFAFAQKDAARGAKGAKAHFSASRLPINYKLIYFTNICHLSIYKIWGACIAKIFNFLGERNIY
jgi:hypothetical protein